MSLLLRKIAELKRQKEAALNIYTGKPYPVFPDQDDETFACEILQMMKTDAQRWTLIKVSSFKREDIGSCFPGIIEDDTNNIGYPTTTFMFSSQEEALAFLDIWFNSPKKLIGIPDFIKNTYFLVMGQETYFQKNTDYFIIRPQ